MRKQCHHLSGQEIATLRRMILEGANAKVCCKEFDISERTYQFHRREAHGLPRRGGGNGSTVGMRKSEWLTRDRPIKKVVIAAPPATGSPSGFIKPLSKDALMGRK